MSYFADWESLEDGYITKEIRDTQLVARPTLDGYLLSISGGDELEPDYHDNIWFADTLEGLKPYADFLINYYKKLEELRARPKQTKRTVLEGGYVIVATSEETYFQAILTGEDGSKLGEYSGSINQELATFVLGEFTIQGAERLDDPARGKGIGDKMRDAAEEVTGLPAVPHGLNYTTGSLSAAAAKSWNKRARKQRVLGVTSDLAINIRNNLIDNFRQIKKETYLANGLQATIKISEQTGCDAVLCYKNGKLKTGWAISSEGLPISPTRIINENILKKFVKRNYVTFEEGLDNPNTKWDFKRFTSQEVASMGIELDDYPSEYANCFIEKVVLRMQSGDLPQVIPTSATDQPSLTITS